MDKETLWRKLAQNQGDYYELMHAARGVIPEDVLKGYERGQGDGVAEWALKVALQAIANLPAGRNEDVMEGQEQAYRAVEAIIVL